jgi:hypothetical protein
MAVMTPRENWTDLMKTREEIAELRSEVRGFEKRMDDRFDAVNRTLQIGFGLMGTMFVAVIGLIGTQL